MDKKTVKPEELEDGKVLLYLKSEFIKKGDQQSLVAFLSCIRDSQLVIPMKLSKKKDGKKIVMEPDILKQGEKSYLPVFSNYEQFPEAYAQEFTAINMSFPGAAELAEAHINNSGLVLDAFSEPFIINNQLKEIILKIDSRLSEE